MAKKQEPQMICPKWETCTKYSPFGCPYSRPHEWSINCARKHGEECPACIPYEPATCPDCDDPIALHDEHGCHAEPIAGGICECKRTPADQQPQPTCPDQAVKLNNAIKIADPEMTNAFTPEEADRIYQAPADQPEKHSVNGHIKKTPQEIRDNCSKCPEWEGFCMVKECVKEQPTQMPLPVEKANKMLDLMSRGSIEGLNSIEVTKLIGLFYSWYEGQQQAHDSEVVAKAVKEFAEKVIKHPLIFLSKEQEKGIRAMAEVKWLS